MYVQYFGSWQTYTEQVQSEFEIPRGLKLKVHSLQKYWRPGELIVWGYFDI